MEMGMKNAMNEKVEIVVRARKITKKKGYDVCGTEEEDEK